MRSLVVYESIWGNTRDVALAVAEELESAGAVMACEVGRAPVGVADFDLVVVGGPIHAWGMTRPMTRDGARTEARRAGIAVVSQGIGVREWLDRLDGAESGQAAAAFDTAVEKLPFFVPRGSAARPEANRLEALGFKVPVPPEHFYVRDKAGPLVAGELERARTWARGLLRALVAT